MNSDQLELVTAYVDGEATSDERARVESDAELLAEVERQRAARADLHHVDPPSPAARESAIAAALAVFDDEVAPSIRPASAPTQVDVTAPTNIVPFEQRRRARWMQSLGAAAAVAAVVAAGAVIATRGGDDSGSTADEARPEETRPEETREETARPGTQMSVGSAPIDLGPAVTAPPAAAVATTAASVLAAAEPTEELTADAASAGDAESPATDPVSDFELDTDTDTDTDAPAAAPPTSSPSAAAAPAPATAAAARVIVVITDDDLRELADTLETPPIDADEAATECADGALDAEAMFEDGSGEQQAIVVVAIDDDTLGALTLAECDVVLEAELDPGS